jgi:hypothetical protein
MRAAAAPTMRATYGHYQRSRYDVATLLGWRVLVIMAGNTGDNQDRGVVVGVQRRPRPDHRSHDGLCAEAALFRRTSFTQTT